MQDQDTTDSRYVQVPVGLLRDPAVTEGAKLLYVELLARAWRADGCTVNQADLAAVLGITVRQVGRRLAELRRLRLVAARQGRGPNWYALACWVRNGEMQWRELDGELPPGVTQTVVSELAPDTQTVVSTQLGHPRPSNGHLLGHPRPTYVRH